jgi:hypothetical protein
VVSEHRQHDFIEMDDHLDEKRKEILDEIKDIERQMFSNNQRQRNTIDEAGYEETIEEIFKQEDEICSAVRNFGSKLRGKVTQHKTENQEISNKAQFTEQNILKSLQDAKALLQSSDTKAILQYRGIRSVSMKSLPLVDKRTPQIEGKCLQEEDIASLFGQLIFKTRTEDEKVKNYCILFK